MAVKKIKSISISFYIVLKRSLYGDFFRDIYVKSGLPHFFHVKKVAISPSFHSEFGENCKNRNRKMPKIDIFGFVFIYLKMSKFKQ